MPFDPLTTTDTERIHELDAYGGDAAALLASFFEVERPVDSGLYRNEKLSGAALRALLGIDAAANTEQLTEAQYLARVAAGDGLQLDAGQLLILTDRVAADGLLTVPVLPGDVLATDQAHLIPLDGSPAVPVSFNPTDAGTSPRGDTLLPVTATRTADYTLALADAGCLVPLVSSAPLTLTVPTNAAVPFPVGTVLYVAQDGAGDVTVAAAPGVVMHVADGAGLKVPGQWSDVSLHKRGTDTWVLKGGVS